MSSVAWNLSEGEWTRHLEDANESERKIEAHAREIGDIKGEQGVVRVQLQNGVKRFDLNTSNLASVTASVTALAERVEALAKPKPWSARVRAVVAALGLGGLAMIVSLIVFLARVPTVDSINAVRKDVAAEVERARSAAQAVEVRAAELSGDIKEIRALLVKQSNPQP